MPPAPPAPPASPSYGASTPPPPPPAAGAPAAAYGAPDAPGGAYGAQQSPYGQPGYVAPAYGTATAKPTPVLSLISLIAGIVGLVGFFVVFIPIVGGVMQLLIPGAAVVLGFLGKKKEPAAKGMWLTGIVLGFVGVGIGLLSIILWSVAFAGIGAYDYTY
jgi:hypothetical protein